ncbi:putative phenylalanine N-monooxygenase [Helianthus annuus]|nr:putative phenylalanine N-monooxygenase [Helianthus annuus]KAJ0959413.1 putative phenylalanine N-monooxygenase [Helianthus annuus]
MMEEMKTNMICIPLRNVHDVAASDPKIASEFLKDKDEIFASRKYMRRIIAYRDCFGCWT